MIFGFLIFPQFHLPASKRNYKPYLSAQKPTECTFKNVRSDDKRNGMMKLVSKIFNRNEEL